MTEAKHLESLTKRIAELEEVHRLARSLTSVNTLYETLEEISRCALVLCQAEHASITLFSSDIDATVKTLVRTPSQNAAAFDHVLNALIGGWVLHHRQPFQSTDVCNDLAIHTPRILKQGIHSVAAVPLTSHETIIGVLTVAHSSAKNCFGDDAVRLLNNLAPLTAKSIERVQLLGSLKSERERLHIIHPYGLKHNLLLAESELMKQVVEQIKAVAKSQATILVTGETGTGKELAACEIHERSERASGPFLAVNCAAIPPSLAESELFGHEQGSFTGATTMLKGKFEMAHGGTLFLDEISAMPLEFQPKLLRVLETRTINRVGSSNPIPVDVRLVAASNKDLQAAVARGEFREDLYYRLNVVPIDIPPLRHRREDIPSLARHFLAEFSGNAKQFCAGALELLKRCDWKGNVRELRNVVERISLLHHGYEITAEDARHFLHVSSGSDVEVLRSTLRQFLASKKSGSDILTEMERHLVQLALDLSEGSITHASAILGIDRNALSRRIEKFQLKSSDSQ
jgi:transcriptional regulator with GAF, ATPase, and Fis domain